MTNPQPSILDSPAISGGYLFPQRQVVVNPFVVAVDGIELACFRRAVNPAGYTVVHFHGNGEAVADYVPDLADEFVRLGLSSSYPATAVRCSCCTPRTTV